MLEFQSLRKKDQLIQHIYLWGLNALIIKLQQKHTCILAHG